MHRILERLDGAASTIVPLAYLAGMMVGTAAYFSGLVLDATLAVGLALAVAVELHGFLEQRRVRALWGACARTPDDAIRTGLRRQLRAHVGILAGLVAFQAFNSLEFLSATWHPAPGFVPVPLQLVIRALVLPAAFLVSGALSPLTVDASDELRHASRQMLHRTLRATVSQWRARIDRARRAGLDLAPIAVALMEDAGDADGARRIRMIAAGLDAAEGRDRAHAQPAQIAGHEALDKPPTGPGSPLVAGTATRGSNAGDEGLAVLTFEPRSKTPSATAQGRARGSNGRGVRTPRTATNYERAARAAWADGARTVGKMVRATGMSHTTASSWVRTLKAEAAQPHDVDIVAHQLAR